MLVHQRSASPLAETGSSQILMGGGVAQERALLRRTAREGGSPLITTVSFGTLIGLGVNLTPRRPIEGVACKRGLAGQIDRVTQGALGITRIGSCKRPIDGNHGARVALIEQVVEPQDHAPVRCRQRRS